MKQQIDELEYELPQCAFKFNYIQAISPDYAEELVDELNKTGGIKNDRNTKHMA